MSALNYDMWVAKCSVMYTYDSPAMWQATNAGSINGINGNVDINFLYKDFSSVIPANTWRTIGQHILLSELYNAEIDLDQ